MKTSRCGVLIFCVILAAGCANGGKYINTRGALDESIYYIEKDTSNSLYTISSNTYGPGKEQAIQVPQPALVDMNSTIQILLAKDRLKQDTVTGQFSKQSEDLLARKSAIVIALGLLEKVVQARHQVIETYQQKKDLAQFYQAKKKAASIERTLLGNLRALWPDNSKEYSLLEDAYDPPSFGKLQEFLNKEIEAIEDANRKIEGELKTRRRVLALEAFLNSPRKEPVAVHLDGYDSLKAESLERLDKFGLDLSKGERERLDANVHATQEMASALERLRLGEAKLNETVQQMRTLTLPQISAQIDEAERLQLRLNPERLAERYEQTKKLFNAFLLIIQQKSRVLYDSKKHELEHERDAILSNLPEEVKKYVEAIHDWGTAAKAVKQDWENATPASMTGLIKQSIKVAKSFEALRAKLPQVASDVDGEAQGIILRYVKDINVTERDMLLKSDEALALRKNLAEYYRDCRDISDLLAQTTASLSRLDQQPMAEMPSSTVSLEVPIENIKDTFINLEATPRLQGDSITVKATLKERDMVVDTSIASFQVERYGHYAELSPAVVLVKPEQMQGGDDGFRFAPVVSWMHHWSPRPENAGNTASVFRALDPAIGIHSAFTNFRSDNTNSTVQIGLGITVSFWKNRLQFGSGYNLMAESREKGQYYYFIGSDLIGLLQTIGISKQ